GDPECPLLLFLVEQHYMLPEIATRAIPRRLHAKKSLRRAIHYFVRRRSHRSGTTTCAQKCFDDLSRNLQGPGAGCAAAGPADTPGINKFQSRTKALRARGARSTGS